MTEPQWPSREHADIAHTKSLAKYGGAEGVRDQGLLESALLRPQNLWHYSAERPSIAVLAASLAHGIAKNHPFFDGNKRTAWILCRLLLKLYGSDLVASQEAKIDAMLALAAGELSEQQFADWLREHLAVGD